MKHWFKLTYSKVFFCALLLLLALNFISTFIEDELLMNSIIPLFIPVFLIFYFVKYNYLGIAFISFLLFSFLGDISYYFFSEESILKTSSILYILSYIQLLIMALPKFKIFKVDRVIGIYLLVVFVINLYFLYTIYEILKVVIPEETEVVLIGVKSLTLIILAFISFAIYLNTQTRQSILFLVATICFAFSTILNYVNHYYLYDWSFIMLYRGTYILGVYFLFRFTIIEGENRKPIEIKEVKETEKSYSSDNILA